MSVVVTGAAGHAGANGSITAPATSPSTHDSGASVTITASANPGYHFVNWTGDVTTVVDANAASTTITMNGNYAITASFAVNTFTITVTQGANGTITPGTTVVNYDGSQSFSIAPNTGYHIVDVLVDGASVGAVATYNFTSVAADHTIEASFYHSASFLNHHHPFTTNRYRWCVLQRDPCGIRRHYSLHLVDILWSFASLGNA